MVNCVPDREYYSAGHFIGTDTWNCKGSQSVFWVIQEVKITNMVDPTPLIFQKVIPMIAGLYDIPIFIVETGKNIVHDFGEILEFNAIGHSI